MPANESAAMAAAILKLNVAPAAAKNLLSRYEWWLWYDVSSGSDIPMAGWTPVKSAAESLLSSAYPLPPWFTATVVSIGSVFTWAGDFRDIIRFCAVSC